MVDYYEQNYLEYHASTFGIDPFSFLNPLVQRLPPSATILDVGCGSGRDMRWFKERGFRPMGLEQSPTIAAMARNHSGCPVLEVDFETYDFSALSFDSLLLVGALVHVAHERFEHILKALRPAGHALITLKEGRNLTETSHGRTFYLWQDQDLRQIFADLNLAVMDFSRDVSKVRDTDIWLGYVLQKTI
ncbi:MAG: class I SAM-dependent methyltransferase [Deltaproteobacteria bacterium]|nr:class I SAM-dependent methyltransferase [Deltaproteobacteria bacterium]